MTNRFVHLRTHSEFSLLDGIVRVKALIGQCAAEQQPAIALTDLTNLYGLVKFYQTALSQGVKPLLGADLWIENPEKEDKPFRMPVLCQNKTGYQNLKELISRAFQENQKQGKPLIKREWLLAQHQGLLLLSGANFGDVGAELIKGNTKEAKRLALEWQAVFGDRFYLEIQRTGRAGDQQVVAGSVAMSRASRIPVVATNDVMFLKQDEFEAHETRVAINEGMALDDPRRERSYSDQQYLKSADDMAALFADIPSAIENSWYIATRCNVEVLLGEYFLPEFPIPKDFKQDPFFHDHAWDTEYAHVENTMRKNQPDADNNTAWQRQIVEGMFFRKMSIEGLERRLKKLFPTGIDARDERRMVYVDRLNFEMDMIVQMGFPGYFLIVMDFIQWAKKNDIPVGPGRGSGAGSLVAYAQDITDLDPITYELLFERFLNPERVSMPDFDVDFCMEKRDKVIAYVADTYGRQAVSQIVTFGTMAAKAVVRDVARVQGKSYGLADRISKLIPPDPGMKLETAWNDVPELVEFVKSEEDAQEIWDMARKLEGITRQTGKHAGGVVIAPTKLTDFSPLTCDEDGGGLVTQFDKNDVESAGLVKFDFLGLRTLTIIDWAVKTINIQRAEVGETPITIEDIPLDDKPAFTLLKKAETTAVFQLESRGMKDLIRRLQPDTLEEMIALVALFRPGPLESGMVEDFINRKHGRSPVAYPHPDFQHESLKAILEPTYGVIVYQEQVMQIAQVLAGYSLGGADLLRRAMGKKKPEEMAKQREVFREGAAGQGVNPELAMKIFDLVEKFAGYGFNKSHSAAYALVSYQTLWLKTHYPAAFMAAVMSSDMQNTDKVVIFIEDSRNCGLNVLPPDVNQGNFMFTANGQTDVIYGLGAVKGVGEGPVEAIVQAKQAGGPFSDLFDFCQRVDHRANKRVIEALIKSGAFDTIIPSRAIAMSCLEDAIRTATQAARNANAGIDDMFGAEEEEVNTDPYGPYRRVADWPPRQHLKGEKDTLGLYLTGHPIDEYEIEINKIVSTRLGKIQAAKKTQTLAGLIVDLRTTRTKRGDTIGFATLDDKTARVEVSFFGEAFEQFREFLIIDEVIVIDGEVNWDHYSERNKVIARQVYNIGDARQKMIGSVQVRIEAPANGAVTKLQALLREDGKGAAVVIDYVQPEAFGLLRLPSQYKLSLDDGDLHQLRQSFGEENVTLNYRKQDINLI